MKYLLIALLLSNSIFAQKLQQPVIDKLTGDTLIGTERVTLFRKMGAGQAGEKLEALVYKSKGSTFLTMIGRTGKSNAFVFNEGDEMNLKLADNSIINLKNLKSESPKTEISPSFGQYWNTVYLLEPNDIQKLSASPVSFIRINHSSGYFDYDIKDKMSASISKCVELLK